MASAVCARLLLQSSKRGLIFSSTTIPTFSRQASLAPSGGVNLRPYCPQASPSLSRAYKLGPSDDENYQRTTVTIMRNEPGSGFLIHSYSSQGFIIDGNRVFGPCALLPPAILQWNVGSFKDITEESVSLFHMLEPKIEILVLGTGGHVEQIDPSVLALLKRKGIAVEVQDTPNACATFNFLTSERRVTAAGLIPPPISTALDLTGK